MCAGVKTVRVATPADNETARPHASGNDAEIPGPRPNGPFACHPDIGTKMRFAGHIIVVAIDDLAGDGEIGQMLTQRVQNQIHHGFAIGQRVGLCPENRLDIIGKVAMPLLEIREISIW